MGRSTGSDETLRATSRSPVARLSRVPCLTILWHRDASRIGEWAWLHELAEGGSVEVSRLTPEFVHPAGGAEAPLACPYLSRRPFWISILSGERCEIAVDDGVHNVRVNGQPVVGSRLFQAADLEHGIVIELVCEIVLFLRFGNPRLHKGSPRAGLVGDSDAIAEVRNSIQQVADLDTPVLLLGETGVGKDLVARALHGEGPRSQGPFVGVNMAAIPATTAAAELFGHERGAFTGANLSREGCFQRANLGTLFLDEIADTPFDVQAMLLRVLESGEAQRLGATSPDYVDVRIIAATDQDLAPESHGQPPMRSALRFRLSGYNLPIPPLRERREDIGRLLLYFLRMELERTGELHRLDVANPHEPSLFDGSDIRKLVDYPWPGNVRQLHNFVRHLVISSRGEESLRLDKIDELLDRTLATTAAAARQVDGPTPPERPAPIAAPPSDPAPGDESVASERELLRRLRSNGWSIAPTARDLGVSRTTVYAMLERSKTLRAPKDIPDEELRWVWAETSGNLSAATARLEVSPRTLKIRLRELGLL